MLEQAGCLIDAGSAIAHGYVRITGRLTDMIIVGGFNTYPAEIENFYLRHPKILDVSIVGVPDPIMGEAVMAFVIPKEGEALTSEEMVAFANGKIANSPDRARCRSTSRRSTRWRGTA